MRSGKTAVPKMRPSLQTIVPDYHGAIDFAELAEWGISPDDIVDFSVNSNPFGSTANVKKAIQTANVARYPDKACLALRDALSHHFGRPASHIWVGNGTAELLWLIAFAFVQPQDKVLILEPTFGEYRRNAAMMGAEVFAWQARPEDGFRIDETAVEQMLLEKRPSLVHWCSPNNPTGQMISLATVKRWATELPQTLFVIDEAYAQFLPDFKSAMALELLNVLVLRSMTKDYALAGIRLGVVVGAPEIIAGLSKIGVPWSVNEVAQVAGMAALADHDKYAVMWMWLRESARQFKLDLAALGFTPAPSLLHYFLLPVGNGRLWREKLLQKGLLVRLCESYRLPEYVRISTQTPEENGRLLAALRDGVV
ncbi:MAG: histidinol-phosphate transaminase [Chloroflexota bacterium]